MGRNSTLLSSILGGSDPLGIIAESRKNNLNMKPIFTQSKRCLFVWTFVLLALISTVSSVTAQTLIAGWDFQTTTTGGVAVLASPNTPKVYPANFGTGTIYFDGTNNSSNWLVASSNSELTAFTGTAGNGGTGFSTTTTTPASWEL
ncbi:MAG: hypothetical protein IPK10_17660 [Bacteroidetes bacterium]|nr:hypothetical protein [Bacteroidota bacterium]